MHCSGRIAQGLQWIWITPQQDSESIADSFEQHENTSIALQEPIAAQLSFRMICAGNKGETGTMEIGAIVKAVIFQEVS